MYLLLAYLKFAMRSVWSLHRMLQVLQRNLLERRPLPGLFTTAPPPSSFEPLRPPTVTGVGLITEKM